MMCCQYLACVRVRPGRARPGCLNEMDLSASLWCRTPGLIELHVPLLSFLLSRECTTNHWESQKNGRRVRRRSAECAASGHLNVCVSLDVAMREGIQHNEHFGLQCVGFTCV